MCTGDASAEDVHPFQSCQPKMNPSDFIFPKGVEKKLRVQIASIFGGMGVGDKNGRWPVKKNELIHGVYHHHHHCNNNHHHNHHPYFVYVTHQN